MWVVVIQLSVMSFLESKFEDQSPAQRKIFYDWLRFDPDDLHRRIR